MLALEISTELGDLIGEGRAAQQLATVADDDEEREEFLLRAVDSWRTAGYAFGATHALLDLARLEIGDGRYRDATVSAELALELAPANLRGDCLVHIGVARAEEDPADIRARASFEEALKGPLEMVDRETVQGFLDRLPVLTDEQRERLARIVNVDQRRALVSALTHGEDIPDYAWTPVPPKTPEFDAMIEGLATEIRDRFGEEGLEAALDPNLLEDDE